jgi:type IV pilus assembly protein PilA
MHDTIQRLREKKQRGDDGFTLIELLVVVVIIGVLVAIAVPVYLSYRQGAADKSAQSDVRGAISAIEQYYTDNANAYPPSMASQTLTFALGGSPTSKVTLSDNTTLSYILAAGGASYKVCAKNSGGNKQYLYNNLTGGSVAPVTGAAISLATCA